MLLSLAISAHTHTLYTSLAKSLPVAGRLVGWLETKSGSEELTSSDSELKESDKAR